MRFIGALDHVRRRVLGRFSAPCRIGAPGHWGGTEIDVLQG